MRPVVLSLLVLACGPSSPDTALIADDLGSEQAETASVGPDTSATDVASDLPDVPFEGDGVVDEDATEAPPFDPNPWVDPFIGTGAAGFNYGAVPPGAARPFAMVRLSPDTGDQNGATFGVGHAGGYRHEDPYLLGFSHIHLVGVGIADYGNLLVMPARGKPEELTQWEQYRAPLDHSAEVAEPGYYRILIPDRGVTAELTSTLRTGLHRYSFDGPEPANLVIDVTHRLGKGTIKDSQTTVDAVTGEVSGFVWNNGEFSDRFGGFNLYFVIRPSRPPTSTGTFDTTGYHAGVASSGGAVSGAVLGFDPAGGPLELRVGISFVDLDGARKNLAAEGTDVTFDGVRAAAAEEWRGLLSKVQVEGGSESRRKILYTALYHVLLMPTLLMDVDARYRGIDQNVHSAEGFTYYSDLSLWDTYRTFHPLVTLLYPSYQTEFLASLTAMAKDWGGLPKWPLAIGEGGSMIGTSADVVFGDAVIAGLDTVDLDTIWPAIRTTAFGPHPAGKTSRDSIGAYMSYGFCPADLVGGSVSKTLEYATEDACAARVAAAAGADQDAATLTARAASWKHHVDFEAGLLGPRNADGSIPPYNATDMTNFYIEGTAWQYTFMVPHDAPGLVAALGGKERFVERLDGLLEGNRSNFEPRLPSGYYWHGNEPGLLTPFLFAFADRPDLARWWVRWIADNSYGTTPGGLAGNDDGGTLSAWYVFAAAGLYPLSCTGQYVLTTPLFDRVTWTLPSATLEVVRGAVGSPVRWNGAEYGAATLGVTAVLGGGRLDLPAQPESKNPPE